MRKSSLALGLSEAFHVAICSSAQVEDVALAACAFALPAPGADNLIQLQVTPAGEFKPTDGRPMKVPAWRINAAIASKVIERFNARKRPLVVDYEHQTLRKEENGQPAPAAAWMTKLDWREGKGLYATTELTARAREQIAAGEYRFFSPVFTFDRTNGDVLDMRMGAFTNDPAIDGMEPLALRAAATFGIQSHEDNSMNKLLQAIIAGLALATTTTEDQAIAACASIKPKLDELGELRKALGIADDVGTTDAIAACTAVKAKADQGGGTPDPAKYVAVGVVEDLKNQVAALTAKTVDREVGELVESGLKDGRLLPAQKDWATQLGKKDIAALTSYLKTAQPIAALTGTQTRGQQPAATDDPNGLTPDELAVCTATGVKPEDFAKTKKAA